VKRLRNGRTPRSPRTSRLTKGVHPTVIALAAMASLLFVLPLIALTLRAPWSTFADLLGQSAVRSALRLSLLCSITAAALSVILGLPLAWVLARAEFPGKRLLRAATLLPVVLPPVVGGLALLLAFGRNGVAGQWLDRWFNVRLPFTTAGAIVAETFVAMPFFVLAMQGAFSRGTHTYEEAAATLGASRWLVATKVVLPEVAPTLLAATVLAWARALGEFGATVTFAGNFPGTTQTLPLSVYQSLETQPQVAIMLSLILVGVSLAVIIALRDHLGGKQARNL
jgi:molybdate transport system permease protein